jgi:uncharacterized DUF497 family protein
MKYEWDEAKAEENARKHGVSFFEAIEVLENSFHARFMIASIPKQKIAMCRLVSAPAGKHW